MCLQHTAAYSMLFHGVAHVLREEFLHKVCVLEPQSAVKHGSLCLPTHRAQHAVMWNVGIVSWWGDGLRSGFTYYPSLDALFLMNMDTTLKTCRTLTVCLCVLRQASLRKREDVYMLTAFELADASYRVKLIHTGTSSACIRADDVQYALCRRMRNRPLPPLVTQRATYWIGSTAPLLALHQE